MPPPSWLGFASGTFTRPASGCALSGTSRNALELIVRRRTNATISRATPPTASRRGVTNRRNPFTVLGGLAADGSEERPREAAVHRNDRAGDVASALRREEADEVGDLLRSAQPAQRDRLEVDLARSLGVDLTYPLGIDASGSDRVDGDPFRADLPRERLRPADHARTDGVRQHKALDRLAHGARRDVDDAPVAALLEVGEAECGQPDDRQEQELDAALYRLGIRVDRRAAGWPAAVVDEDVDPAEGLDRPVDEPAEIARRADVAADGERCQTFRLALEHVAAPGEHGHVGTLAGQRRGDRKPHAGGGAADDRGAPVEAEVHYVVRTPTTSRTASADSRSAACSSSDRSSSTISSTP